MSFAKVTETVMVKREFTAQEYDFCGLCGARYEAGERLALIAKAVDARGRFVHPACVIRANKIVSDRVEKIEREKDMIEIPRARTLLDAVTGNFYVPENPARRVK